MQAKIEMTQAKRDQRGVVSIFIVIFAAILMTIITVSFLSLMIHDQQQATDNELSQNAYDSAMSGVEDAKRAIAACGQGTASGCDNLSSSDCTMLSTITVSGAKVANFMTGEGGNKEVPLQNAEGDANSLNQAYTCVTIDTAPTDYKADLTKDNPTVIPLTAQGAGTSSLTLSWQAIPSRTFSNSGVPGELLNLSSWTATKNYPPMMRVQLIKGSSSVTSSTNSKTLFLYPVTGFSGVSTADFSVDNHNSVKNHSVSAYCEEETCSTKLKDGDDNMFGSDSYLVITPLYENASVKLAISGGGTFDSVQDVVDSTGRANDLFRRVQARVDLIPHPTYPNAELNLTGPLCKNFTVTPDHYYDNTTLSACK